VEGCSGLPGNPDHRGTNRSIGDINNNHSKPKCDSLEPKYCASQYIKIMMMIIMIIIIGLFRYHFALIAKRDRKRATTLKKHVLTAEGLKAGWLFQL